MNLTPCDRLHFIYPSGPFDTAILTTISDCDLKRDCDGAEWNVSEATLCQHEAFHKLNEREAIEPLYLIDIRFKNHESACLLSDDSL